MTPIHITFAPIRSDDRLTLSRSGDILTVNDRAFDLSSIADGATLSAADIDSDWFADDVVRTNGALYLSLFLPHGATAPTGTRFPAAICMTQDGPVPLPPHDGESVT